VCYIAHCVILVISTKQDRQTRQERIKMTHGERIQMYQQMSSDELRKAIAEYSKLAQRAQQKSVRKLNKVFMAMAQAELDGRN
jgi:acyl-CoA reductase-like NAD-dependent aldehyde dehydrogenase